MTATHFMHETSEISSIIFANEVETDSNNRLFRLQNKESVTICSNSDDANFLYVLKGEINVTNNGKKTIISKTDAVSPGAFKMPKDNAVVIVKAQTDCVIYHIDEKRLDDVLSWIGIAQSFKNDPEKLSILSKVLSIQSLNNLPLESMFELISRMQLTTYKKDDEVVSQGAEADHFYIIHHGEADVWATGLYDDEAKVVSTLTNGDSFGEDALVTGGTRNATVKMKTDGVLLVGSQKDFMDLIANPCIDEVGAEAAQKMCDNEGYELIDVRYEEEYEDNHIEGCQLVPLHELRDRFGDLSEDKKYITYCRSGKRSAVAALILKRNNFDVVSMTGGISQWPYATKSLY